MYKKLGASLVFSLVSFACYAEVETCPDPQTLKWEALPKSWQISPFSSRPQGSENMKFVRANILLAGLGQGVACTYKNSLGLYSIWWQVRVKIPARDDYNWIYTFGGFACSTSIKDCQFGIVQ